jgi:ubiquinone/menaquinone biosynthesis C-methylase UbiE
MTKPLINDLSPLVSRLERKLTSSSSFLPQGAHLQLINSALTSLPLHFLCTPSLPLGLTKQFDRIIRQFLWRDFSGEPKQSLAAWDLVCKPKKCGGLGIVNFQKQNAALLIKFLDKFYNKVDLPWVHLLWSEYYLDSIPRAENLTGSFWWRDVSKQVDNFKGVSSVKPRRGDSFLFWLDRWHIDGSSTPLCERFPRLYSFVLCDKMSAAMVYEVEDISTLFYLPLSAQAFEELNQLQRMMSSSSLEDRNDEWTYIWGGSYRASKFYAHIHSHISVPSVYKWV